MGTFLRLIPQNKKVDCIKKTFVRKKLFEVSFRVRNCKYSKVGIPYKDISFFEKTGQIREFRRFQLVELIDALGLVSDKIREEF